MAKVFLSHSSADRAFVAGTLIPALKDGGVSVWHSDRDVHTAEDFERKIRQGLASTEWFVVVVSRKSAGSEWVRAELKWAMKNRPGRVIPIVLDGTDPADLDLRLSPINYIPFHEDLTAAKTKLLSVLRDEAVADSQTPPPRHSPRLKLVLLGTVVLVALAFAGREYLLSLRVAPDELPPALSLAATETLRRMSRLPHDFVLRISTADQKVVYYEGDTIAFRLESDRGAHVAALFYGADGSTLLMFPNGWNRETFIPAKIAFDIPGGGSEAFKFVVSPPFGVDLLQVVACADDNAFHRHLRQLAATSGARPFHELNQDSLRQLTDSVFQNGSARSKKAGTGACSEAHLVVYSRPKGL